ncbi:MAG: hemerythrin domain-containing protein [Candidatus Pacebacteria bacterium]|nr:hemerythrin domain-containing protein [Candidatus Paceibacterota bacterium]
MDISKFLHQHEEALELLQRLEDHCKQIPLNSREVSESLVGIAAQLKFHLAMEDKFLYPKASQSSDAELKSLSHHMSDEMMEISKVFDKYVNAWTKSSIDRDSAKFLAETAQIIAAIRDRIEREEGHLYPLAEARL